MARHSRFPRAVVVSLIISFIVLNLALTASGSSLSPEATLQAAWRNAQRSGVYNYASEVIQTTYPAPTLSNVGQVAREDRLYLEGKTNLPDNELLFTLWRNGGNVVTGRQGVEVRVVGDQAFGRVSGEDWQPINDFSGTFAPGQDVLAYLAGARNVRQIDDKMTRWQDDRVASPWDKVNLNQEITSSPLHPVTPSLLPSVSLSKYQFDLDGSAIGRYVRDQLERYLLEHGQLPGGLSLSVPDAYRTLSGTGEVWLSNDELPARLTLTAEFPQQQTGERVKVTIQTDFSNFAPLKQAGLSWPTIAASLGLSTARDWQRLGLGFSALVLMAGFVALLIVARRSKVLYRSVALAMISSMVIGPALQSQQVYAFGLQQTDRQAQADRDREESQAVREAITALTTSSWDPHTVVSGQSSVVSNQQSALAGASNTSTDNGVDTDHDGLTDWQEINSLNPTDPYNPDSDGDGLTDGEEVKYLGTDPNKADTDGDLITDNAEVAGFSYRGQMWYTNPRSIDTNLDGLTDGLECPQQTRPSLDKLSTAGAVCQDLDSDGTPDVFDPDNDGDGVNDRTDTSPDKQLTGFDAANPFKLVVQSLTPGQDVFVDVQIRPVTATHLTYAMNVLDWPTGDAEGQVTRLEDTTWADLLTPAQANADPKTKNGDMRLTPMLEVTLRGDTLPLPRTTPRLTLQTTTAATGWISATAKLGQVGADTILTLTHTATAPVTVTVNAGRCFSATALAAGATPVITLTSVASDVAQTMANQKLLKLADGAHALSLEQGSRLACLNLIDLPNGANEDQMIDSDRLGNYGLVARDVNASGAVVVYAPLNIVNDTLTDQRQAFTARLLYRVGADGAWGQAQDLRLVWLVQLLNDDLQTQTIHVYPDSFNLTGLAVREDRGLTVSVALEDPIGDKDIKSDDGLWKLAAGLHNDFTSGRKAVDAQGRALNERDLTLNELWSRFAVTSTSTITDRWGIALNAVKVINYTFDNQDGLAQFPAGKNKEILDTYFTNNGVPRAARADAPTLLFAREERYRSLNLQGADNATVNGNLLTLTLSPDRVQVETLAAFNWSPFRYVNGSWQPYPLREYWDLATARYRQIINANPPDYLNPTDPDYASQADVLVMAARANYVTFMQGEIGVVQVGSDVFQLKEPEEDELGSKIFVDTIGGTLQALAGTLVKDLVIKEGWAKNSLASALRASDTSETFGNLFQMSMTDALDQVADQVDQFEKGSSVGKFVNGDGWGVAGMAVAGVALAASIFAAWNGSFAAEVVAASCNVAAALFGAAEAALQLINIAKQAGGLFNAAAKNIANTLTKAADKAGIVGLVISGAVALGLFIYQWAAGGLPIGGLAFNAALASMVATILAAAIMLAIAMIPVVGQIIAAVVALIDSIIALVCKAAGLNDPDQKGTWWADVGCSGINGAVTWLVESFIYSSTSLVGNLTQATRLDMLDFKPTLLDVADGYAVGSRMQYNLTVRNKITLTDPLSPAERRMPDWKSLLYFLQFNSDNLRRAAFAYSLGGSDEEQLDVTYNSMREQWQLNATVAPTPTWTMPDRPLTATLELSEAGINQTVDLYLNEAYATPTQECYLTLLGPLCLVREDNQGGEKTKHYNVGASLKWDVFPATLDEFYAPAEVTAGGGYALAWGQQAAITVTNAARALVFPRLKDFDGDGLLNKIDGGPDPDDSKWDTDGDGLSDPYELAHGTDPTKADTDGDGLNDYAEVLLGTDPTRADSDGDGLTDVQEITGWELVYGYTATGAARKTWVKSDPLKADADSDGLNDAQEKAFGTNPNVYNSAIALTYQSQLSEATAAQLLLRFSETADAHAFADASGYGRAATCAGAACPTSGVSGKVGNALDFDGGDVISATNAIRLDNAAFTVAFWAKRAATSQDQWIVRQSTLNLGFRSDNTFTCSFGSDALNTSATYPDTDWHHWACTFDVSNRAHKIYRDGVQVASGTASANTTGTGEIVIGTGFTGRVDEVFIARSALSAAQVQNVRDARYSYEDLTVQRGDVLQYVAEVANQLLNRTAQGLLNTLAPASVINAVPPTTFVLPPTAHLDVSGTLTVKDTAPAGSISVTQIAGGQIIDWRQASDYADLWLKLDDAANSTTFLDSSGVQPARHATCTGNACPAANQAGMRGKAAAFDGVNDMLFVADGVNWNPAYLTIAAWVKADNFAKAGAPVITKGNGGGGEVWNLDFVSGRPRLYFYKNRTAYVCQADAALPIGTWTHLAGTYDGANVILYVNGSAVKTCPTAVGPLAAGPLAANTHAVSIGSRQAGNGAYDLNFAGTLDDVRVYPRALTVGDINALYGGPVLQLNFEGTSSSGAPGLSDSSGSGNHATCVGTACPTQVTGLSGGGLNLSGSQYAQINSSNGTLNLNSGRFTQMAWVYPVTPIEIIPASGCDANTPLRAEYFNNRDLTNPPVISRCEALPQQGLNFNWGGGSPDPLVNSDDFSIRWTTSVRVNTADTYNFTEGGDDGFRAYWDNTAFINDWNNGGYRATSVAKTLSAGTHDLKLEYYENSGGAAYLFYWPQWASKMAHPQGILGANSGETNGYPTVQRVGLKLRVGFGDGTTWREFTTSNDVLTPNQWNHVATTFDGTTYRVYVNATEVANTNTLSGYTPNAGNTVSIGRSTDRGRIYLKSLVVTNEKDGAGNAELCMAWRNSPSASQQSIWSNNNVDVGTYSLDLYKDFTDQGYVRLWEDDGGTFCGDNEDDGDDFVWDRTFSANDPSLPDEANDYWTRTNDSEGYTVLGSNAQVPHTPAVTVNAIPFRGRLDDVRIYRYPLTSADIDAAYQSGLTMLHLRFDDAAGAGLTRQGFANAIDPSNVTNGTCASAEACPITGLPGRINLAASFDGNDVVNVPINTEVQQLSIATWVKLDALPDNVMRFITLANEKASLRYDWRGLDFFVNLDGTVQHVTAGNIFTRTGIFYHVAGTYDGAIMRLYVNGAQVNSRTIGGVVGGGTGVLLSSTSEPLIGTLDDVRIYRKALMAAEVQTLAQAAPAVLLHLDEVTALNGFKDVGSGVDGSCSGDTCPVVGLKGQLGYAAKFDGLNNYLSVADNAALKPTRLSISAWIKASAWTSEVWRGVLVAKDTDAGGNAGYSLRTGSGKLSFVVSVNGTWCEALSPEVLSVGLWSHVIGTYDGTQARVYVNGVQQGATTCAGSIVHSSTALNIGRSPTWTDRLFNGLIDEVAIYPSALEARDVRDLYRTQLKHVEDRAEFKLTVDTTAPTSELKSYTSNAYRLNAAQVLGVTASDTDAGVALVELGACRGSSCTFTWSAADQCLDSSNGASWCPTFDPTGPGGEGRYSLQTRATDKTGQRETPSQTYTLYVDGTAPTITSNTNNDALLAATIDPARDGWSVPFSGTVGDPNLATGEAGSGVDHVAVTVYDSANQMAGLGVQQAVINGTAWAVSYPFNEAPTGAYTLTIEAKDKVGNTSAPITRTLKLDTSAPEVSMNLSDVPTSTITSTVSLRGTFTDTPASPLNFFGVQSVDAAFFSIAPTFFNEPAAPAGQMRYFPFEDQMNAQGKVSFTDLAGAQTATCADAACPTPGVAGVSGQAAQWDGRDDALNAGNVNLANASFTFAFWARRAALNRWDVIVGQGPAQTNEQLSIGFTAANKFTCGFYENDLITNATYTDTDWHHWACAYNAADKVRTLYRDGAQIAQDTATADYAGTGTLYLGSGVTGTTTITPTRYFGGALDDVYLFNRALGSTEIQVLFAQAGGRLADPIAQWPFDVPRAVTGTTFASGDLIGVLTTGANDDANKAVRGQVGVSALQLDGSDVVKVSSGVTLANQSFSVALWARRASTGSDQWLIAQGATSPHQALRIGFRANDTFTCAFGGNDLNTVAYTDTAWHHWACTYNATSQQRTIYRDGVNVAQAAAANYAGSGAFYLGANDQANGFVGALDDVRLYGRALSAHEVKEMTATGWTAASISGTGGASATFTTTLPAGLEGSYRLAVRPMDLGNTANTQHGNEWNGEIDTLAPRVLITRTHVTSSRTRYELSAEDYNLTTSGLTFAPCAMQITSRQDFAATWYRAQASTSPRLYAFMAMCEVNEHQTSAVGASVCDAAGNCATANIGAGLRAERNAPLAPDYTPGLYISIDTPADGAILTDYINFEISGTLHADNELKELIVTADGVTVLQNDTFGPITETIYSTNHTFGVESAHTIAATLTDTHNVSATVTHTLYVDVFSPTVELTTLPVSVTVDARGNLILRGTVTDTGGIVSVRISEAGGASTTAGLNGEDWIAQMPIGLSAPIDGETYTLWITATDRAGREAIINPTLVVDVIAPTLEVTPIDFEGAPLTEGQTYTSTLITATFALSTTDRSVVDRVGYAWLTQPVRPADDGVEWLTRFPTPVPEQQWLTYTTVLSTPFVPQAGAARYLYVAAQDVIGRYTDQFFGPFYQDPPGGPDYISMLEPRGPFAGQPYRAWQDSGCTLAGTDTRMAEWAQAGSALTAAQNFYFTRDADNLRLTWTGANWDTDGDLFIYFDSLTDLDGSRGGYVAYNPYSATVSNTVVLLPVLIPNTTFGSPGQLLADYAVWVQNSQSAQLLAWDDLNKEWTVAASIPLVSADQPWGYRFDNANGGTTDLSIPFAWLGGAQAFGDNASLVAFATEDDALRLWSVMPPQNPVNSVRVTHLAPAIGQPAKLMLTTRYSPFDWTDDRCLTRSGRLQAQLTTDPGNLSFSSTDDETRLLLPHPVDDALPAWDFENPDVQWPQMYDPYTSTYRAWLNTDFCAQSINFWHAECNADPRPAQQAYAAALSTYTQAEYPPIGPNKTVTFTLKVDNSGDTTYADVWAVLWVNDNEYPDPIITGKAVTWPNDCNLIHLGDIAPGASSAVIFTGTTGAKGLLDNVISANLYRAAELDPIGPPTCTHDSIVAVSPLASLQLAPTYDNSARYAAIVSPRTTIPPYTTTVSGFFVDNVPADSIMLRRFADVGGGMTDVESIPCANTTPATGQWSCAWNVTASNGGTRPADGTQFMIDVIIADEAGVSAFSLPITLTVDSTPPTITLGETLRPTDTLLGGGSPVLTGIITDNYLIKALEVCDENGDNCGLADLTFDADTVPTNTVQFDDVADTPVAFDDGACNNFGAITRTFHVSETFDVSDIQVGFNVTHTYRGDVSVRLLTPSGLNLNLMPPGGSTKSINNRRNWDVLLTNAGPKKFLDDWFNHDTGAPYFENALRPQWNQQLSADEPSLDLFLLMPAYNGKRSAQGDWVLMICDSHFDGGGTAGYYNRSRLILRGDPVPVNTRANWSYALPNVEGSDNTVYTSTLFAIDSVGNRSRYTPDGMQPASLARGGFADPQSPQQPSPGVLGLPNLRQLIDGLITPLKTDATYTQTLSYRVDNIAPTLTVTQFITTTLMTDTLAVLQGTVYDGGDARVTVTRFDPFGVETHDTLTVTGETGERVWAYALTPDAVGEYTLYVNAVDGASNVTISGPYTLITIKPYQIFLPLVQQMLPITIKPYQIFLPMMRRN